MSLYTQRTEMLYGPEGVERLRGMRVAVFGIGGVGGHAAESLARCGIGTLEVFDNDTVAPSNLNRQLIADTSTVGMPKTEAFEQRAALTAPDCRVIGHELFYAPDTADRVDLRQFDFVADCIDFVPGKLALAEECHRAGVPLISAMGTGNKLHPERLELTDIYKTSVCPLARVMRRELRKRGIPALTVVYSREEPRRPAFQPEGKLSPASSPFVPGAAGLMIGSYIVNKLLGAGE